MIRRVLVVVCSAVLLVGSAVHPADAARDVRTVVHGHDLVEAGLQLWYDGCNGGVADPPVPNALSRRGGFTGTHAIGWQFDQSGYQVAPLATVLRPATLSTFSMNVLSPTSTGTGSIVAFYYDDTPGFTDGFWFGRRGLTNDITGWAIADGLDSQLTWTYYQDGASPVAGGTGSIASFATSRGGDGNGAYVGISQGCDGQAFYVDNLKVGDADGLTTYDFEAFRSNEYLYWAADGKKVYAGNLVMPYGSRFWALGDSEGVIDGTEYSYEASGTLYQRVYGSHRWRKVRNGRFDARNYAVFTLSPKRLTKYRFDTDGDAWFDGGGSRTMVASVVGNVRGRRLAASVLRDHPLGITGHLLPRNRGTAITLQHKVHRRWVDVGHARSSANGSFRVTAKARTVGTWTLRLRVASGNGNVGFVSTSVSVQVKAPVVHHHHQAPPPPAPPSSGGSTGGDTPSPTTILGPPPHPGDSRLTARVPAFDPRRTVPEATTAGLCSVPGAVRAPCAPPAATP